MLENSSVVVLLVLLLLMNESLDEDSSFGSLVPCFAVTFVMHNDSLEEDEIDATGCSETRNI